MATLNATKWGTMSGVSSGTFSTARTSNAFTVSNSPTTTIDPSQGYTATSGRGSLTHRFWRSFFTFDVSGITGTVSSAVLKFRTATGASGNYIALKSNAFNGSNSNLVSTEFYSSINYGALYSGQTAGAIANPFSITLNSSAYSDIQNNSWFICAVVQTTNDYLNSAAAVATDNTLGTDWSTTPYLEYTAAASGPANISSINTISLSNISSINTISKTNIEEVNGIS